MQSQFNLFGFEIQIRRPQTYSAEIYWKDMREDDTPYTVHSSSFLICYVKAWQKARMLAEMDQETTPFVLYKCDSLGDYRRIFSASVNVKKVVQFFPTLNK